MRKLILVIFMMLAMSVGAYAITCTYNPPATVVGTANTYIRNVTNISVNITGTYSGENATAGVITVNTGSISGALRFNLSEVNSTMMNFSVNTGALKDDTTYTFTVEVFNGTSPGTGASLTTCSRAFIPDNSVPAFSAVVPEDGAKQTSKDVSFSQTCSNTSSAWLFLEGKQLAMTESSDACSLTLTQLAAGKYSWYILATDGLNSTTGNTTTFEISLSGGSAYATQTSDGGTSQGAAGNNNQMFAYILLGAGAWYLLKKKK